jgi:RNA polymerase sigma-70 factor (ECF subfamily)
VDRESFDRLLIEHLPAAQRFAIRLSGDVHAAEDLLHDAIVRAVNASGSFEGRSKFTTWWFAIIVNCFRDRLRARSANVVDEDVTDVAAVDPFRATDAREVGKLVAQRVSNLPPRQREVLVLVVYEQMPATQVAQVLGISEQSVRTNLSYARERLKQELAPYLNEAMRGV